MKRFSLLTDDMSTCIETGKKGQIEIHEVYFGTANRRKSIEYGCCIPLSAELHNTNYSTSIHKNKPLDMKYKKIMQKAFEKKYGHDKFMSVFHKNYL